MKIRIDPHLQKFEVIRQLRDLIIEYNKKGGSGSSEYSFTDYLYSQSIDSVRRFLLLCIPSGEDETLHTQMINYWTERFQTFRGTLKIFDYLEEMGGVMGIKIGRGKPGDPDYVPPYFYDTNILEVNFIEVETTDINLFTETAAEFFKALLYYQDLRDTYETLKLTLTSEISINLSAGVQFYSSYIVRE